MRKLFTFVPAVLLLAGCSINVTVNTESSTAEETANTVSPAVETQEASSEPEAEETVVSESSIPDAYIQILDDTYYQLCGYPTADNTKNWIYDVRSTAEDSESSLSLVGYALMDVNEDGTEELLIGDIGNEETAGTMIYNMYTLSDGEAVQVFEGWYRSSYTTMENGNFLYRGSASAFSGSYGLFYLPSDSIELACEDFYFTDAVDEEFTEFALFHNTTGEWDKESSEKTDIPEEKFYDQETEWLEEVNTVELTGFTSYEPENAPVGLVRAEYGLADECVLDLGDNALENGSTHVELCAVEDVYDLTFIAIELKDSDNVLFTGAMVTSEGNLKAGESLTFRVDMIGDIPNWGIGYCDAEGNQYYFGVAISGETGDIYLMPINLEA